MRHNFDKGTVYSIAGKDWIIVSEVHKGLDHIHVKSVETGYTTKVKKVNFTQGKIKDYYLPTVCGVGYIGRGKFSPTVNKKSYATWTSMLQRVYIKATETYKDVEVCKRWHNFQWFCEDIRKLPGFKLWAASDNIHLDKDIIDRSAKVYSPTTCQFVTCKENQQRGMRAYNRLFHVVKDAQGRLYDVINQREFCETYGLPVSNFNAMIKGNRTICKGFTLVSSTTEKVYTAE